MSLTLILAAVIPALLLLRQIYREDRLEKEPASLLLSLLFWGVVAAELAALAEQGGIWLLERLLRPGQARPWTFGWAALRSSAPRSSRLHDLLLYFGVVGLSEEGFKYLLLFRRTWRDPAFNCSFDGVVYAVFLSLGFALWENVHYVLSYGLGTALVRAVTAVPGHACFGVFMGLWYGLGKRSSLHGNRRQSRRFLLLAVLIPALLHGVYDYSAMSGTGERGWIFLPFVLAMFFGSWLLVRRLSQRDAFFR